MKARERKKFVEAWKSHSRSFGALAFTPSEELSNEVKIMINKWDALIERVADDKIEHSKRRLRKVV